MSTPAPALFCIKTGCNRDRVPGSDLCVVHANNPQPIFERDKLYRLHLDTCGNARELMKTKNEDYAVADDPYRNFRTFGRLGILVRLSDKLARLRTFEERGTFSVADENVKDTVQDIINYAILYLGYE